MASTTYPPRGPAAKLAVAIPQPRAGAGARAAATPQMAATQTGIWVCVCAIFMCFAAFVSALVVREGASADWQRLVLPRVLYFNTLVLLLSSYTLEVCRRRFAAAVRQDVEAGGARQAGPLPWLYATIMLGGIFVIGQWLAWRNLTANGLYLATNPSSSFFYVLTAMHGLHLLGGMAGLIYMTRRLARGVTSIQASALGAAAIYWHFMGLLWIFLFLVMAIRL
jgi:cytochrome c oxidase subunit III